MSEKIEEIDHVCRYIKTADDAFARELNNAMRSEQLTMSQSRILVELAQSPRGAYTLKELEQRVQAAQSTVWGVVSRLEKAGLVVLTPNPEDSRSRLVHITKLGLDKLATCRVVMQELDDRVSAAMTPEERDLLVDLLGRVIGVLNA